jgi:hypothetical protein
MLRELVAGVLAHGVLEGDDQGLEVVDVEVDVAGTPLADLALSSASENTSPGISRTVLPNIWISRRYESQANRSSPDSSASP